MLLVLPMTSILFGISGIYLGVVTVNETGITFDVLVYYLYIYGIIISIFNCYPSIPMNKALLSVGTGALIVFMNGHENILFCVTPYLREMYTVTVCTFTAK